MINLNELNGTDAKYNAVKNYLYLYLNDTKKNDNINKQFKFSYYGDTQYASRHNGIITIVTTIKGNEILYGVAFCSPKDRYSKKKGKEIAIKYMYENNRRIPLGEKKHDDINFRVASDILINNLYPSWAKKNLTNILFFHVMH